MKAVIYEKYGTPDVLELKDIEKPVPKNNEVLLRCYTLLQASPHWFQYYSTI